MDYKFRAKHDLPIVTKRFENVAQLAVADMQRQLDAGAGRTVFKDYIKAIEKYFIVTVDWVVLTAAIVGLGIAVLASVSGGVTNLSGDIAGQLSSQTIAAY